MQFFIDIVFEGLFIDFIGVFEMKNLEIDFLLFKGLKVIVFFFFWIEMCVKFMKIILVWLNVSNKYMMCCIGQDQVKIWRMRCLNVKFVVKGRENK